MKSLNYIKSLFIVVLIYATSCSEDWLESKRDLDLIVPTTLNDMQLLIQDENNLSKDNNNLMELSGDDYYIPSALFSSRTPIEKNTYRWNKDIYEGQQNIADWNQAYSQIEVANVVLDGLLNIPRTNSNQQEWDNIKGSALHIRGRALYYLCQTFAPQYDGQTASSDLGIPIRLTADINPATSRASVQDTYDQILEDFEGSANLLPNSPEFIMDASRPSAYGYLARCYLVMGNYAKAFEYADKYLEQHSALLDYNSLNLSSTFPIPRYNIEVIQHAESSRVYGVFIFSLSRIHNDLFVSYDDNDLRKYVFFRDMGSGELGTYAFRGSYTGGAQLFSGISTNEMYLIRAECNARLENTDAAMDDLNTLLVNRWATGTFIEYNAGSSEEALDLILLERRKELIRRGQRWIDLRRLNKDAEHATTIYRMLDGIEYQLLPNDPKYVLPIPDYIISISGIEQNQR